MLAAVIAGVLAALVGAEGFTPAADRSGPAAAATGLVEVPGLRTATSKTFQQQNGPNVTRVWQSARHFRGAGGRWEEIDSSFKATASGFRNGANGWRVDVPAAAGGAVRAQMGDDWVSFALRGARGSVRAAGGGVAADVLPGVQARYALGANRLKEELVLADRSAPSTFRYSLSAAAGLTPRVTRAGAIEFRDAAGESRLSLAAPVMWDAAGARSRAVEYEIEREGAGWALTVRADEGWVDAPQRRYPVTVDPTVTFTDSNDTYMIGGTGANTQFGPDVVISTGQHGDGRPYRGLLKFNVSGIPKQAIVMSSQLNLRSTGSGDARSVVGVHRASRSWTGNATWNKHDGVNAWTTPGGDFTATAEDTEGVDGNTTQWVTWHVGTAVQDWVTGASSNHGFVLKETTEAPATSANFRSSTYSTSADQPYLQVEWHHRTGESREYTYDRHKLNDRTELMVNVANGNLIVKHQDINIAGAGPGITVNRYWNSLGTGWWNLGSGWTTDVGADVWRSQYDEGRYTFIFGPSMVPWKFKRIGGSGSANYESPPAVNAKLVWDPAAYEHRLTFNETREVWVFPGDDDGISERRDKNGNKITYVETENDGNGTVNQIVDPQQSRTLTTDDVNTTGRLESITDSAYDGGAGRTWTYGYGSYGTSAMARLTSYTDPDNGGYTYNYGNGLLLQDMTDPRGNKIKFTWDSNGSGRLTGITRVTDPVAGTGPTTTYTYNAAGSETCPVESQNVPALTTTITDPRGNSTTGDPNDGKTVYRWDEKTLRVCKTTNAAGHDADTKFTPNGDGNSFTNNPGGTGNSAVNTLTYDTAGTDPSNRLDGGTINKSPTNTTTDEESFSLGYWNSTNRTGDQFSGLERQLPRSYTDTNGNDTFYGYDSSGNVTDVKDDEASPANKATLTYTDGTNLPGVPKGLIRTAADGRGNTTTYNYNTKGQLTSVVPPSPVGQTTFTYDDSSRTKTVTDGKGQVATYCYDKLDRTTRIYWSGGAWHEFTYDKNGNQTDRKSGTGATSCTNAVTAAQTTTRVFDALNRQTSETFPGSVTNTYVYDVNSQLDTFTDPAGTVDYGYDQIDRVTTIAFPGTITAPWGTTQNIGIAYDDPNRKRTLTFPGTTGAANGIKLVTQSDKAGKPALIQALDSASANLRKLEYTYRPSTGSQMKTLRYAETLTAGTGTPSSTYYKYDPLGRMCATADVAAPSTCPTSTTAATYGTGATNRLEYVYDNASNRTLRRTNGAVDWQAAYNAANQMCWSKTSAQTGDCTSTPTGATAYSYDANGNLTSGYTYDVRNRLSAISTSALSYLSPTNGELTDVGGQPFHNTLLGLSRKSSTTAAYLRLPDGELLMDRRSTGVRAVIRDALGSTRWLLAGNAVDRGYTYTPDGVDTVSGLGTDIDIRFAGGHRVNVGDGSPVYHFGARYYRPNIARWTQRDPLDQPRDLRQANPYIYAGADPVNIVDPDGLIFGLGDCKTALIGFGIAKAFSTAAIATGGGAPLGLWGNAITTTWGAAVTAEACD
jgi:RHS repeat-associated protein